MTIDIDRVVEAIGNSGWRTIGSVSARRAVVEIVVAHVRDQLRDELINTPETRDFIAGVALESTHQRDRWGSDHDAGKQPADWFWLLGYLSGKALAAAIAGDREKACHHTISSAAALANWHASLANIDTRMRPGAGQ